MTVTTMRVVKTFIPPQGRFNESLLVRVYWRNGIKGSRDSVTNQDVADAAILLRVKEGLPEGYGAMLRFDHSTYNFLLVPWGYDWTWKVTSEGERYLREHHLI